MSKFQASPVPAALAAGMVNGLRWPIAILKFATVALMLKIAPDAWADVISERIKHVSKFGRADWNAFYAFNLCLSFAALIVIPFVASNAVRYSLSIIAALGLAADLIYRSVTGQFVTVDVIATLLAVRTQAPNAFQQYA